jgi:predicted Zn-dependent peptidase
MMELLKTPSVDDATLAELKKIVLVQRADSRKQAPSIGRALEEYNRYGAESTYLNILPEATLDALAVPELQDATRNLLDYKHVISYTGALSLEEVEAALNKHYPVEGTLKETPPYQYRRVRETEGTEIYFVNKKEAQANVRIEFGSINYDEATNPAAQLYNGYFSGGMAGIVFQELREARALAYSAAARYIEGGRKNEQNRMVGAIQTQADKTIDAVEAFIDLLDNLPESPERFAMAQQAIVNRYRTAKIGFRSVTGAVRGWECLGLDPDPRKARYNAIQESSLDTILNFHKEYITGKPKLISIVGDSERIDLDALAKIGEVKMIALEDIFVD